MIDILWQITKHQAALGKYPLELNSVEQIQYIRDLTLATHVELTEFLQELPWKPWKPRKPITDQIFRYDRAKDELVDVFIFVLNLWTALRADDCLSEAILSKIDKNMARLQTGTHKQHNDKEEL